MTSTAKAKSKFRRSAKWLTFRRKLKYKRKYDELTLKPLLPGWNLHHKKFDESSYEDISNEQHFSCLNKMSHKFAHWVYTYYVKDPAIIDRLKKLLDEMKELNDE